MSPTAALGSPLQVTSKRQPGRLTRVRSQSKPVETITVASFNSSLSRRTATESSDCFLTLTTVARIACFTCLVRFVDRRRISRVHRRCDFAGRSQPGAQRSPEIISVTCRYAYTRAPFAPESSRHFDPVSRLAGMLIEMIP
jgi:hypothetical protein